MLICLWQRYLQNSERPGKALANCLKQEKERAMIPNITGQKHEIYKTSMGVKKAFMEWYRTLHNIYFLETFIYNHNFLYIMNRFYISVKGC